MPYFGFKAKPPGKVSDEVFHCTVPYFGFKAKPSAASELGLENCTVPYFGFKAKQQKNSCLNFFIVLCLILDSRQNKDMKGTQGKELYCALFWIQGKTMHVDRCWI